MLGISDNVAKFNLEHFVEGKVYMILALIFLIH